jgi:hypothetical protein
MQEALQDLDSVPLEVVVNRRTMFVSVRLWLAANRKFHDACTHAEGQGMVTRCPWMPGHRRCLSLRFDLQICGPSYTFRVGNYLFVVMLMSFLAVLVISAGLESG